MANAAAGALVLSANLRTGSVLGGMFEDTEEAKRRREEEATEKGYDPAENVEFMGNPERWC